MSCRWPLPDTPATPTISPRADRQRHVAHRRLAAVVQRAELLDDEPRRADSAVRAGCTVSSSAPDHHARHAVGTEILDVPLPGELAAAQDGHLVGERHHLAEFVGDHQDGELAARHHGAQHAEHLVRLAGVSTEVGSSRMRKRRLR